MIFSFSKWLDLPLGTRVLIANKFGITKIGATHVADNRIVADGYKVQDVETALNADAVRDYLGVDETDGNTLFDLLVAKITNPNPVEVQLSGVAEVTEVVPPAPVEPAPETPIEKPKRKPSAKKAVKKAAKPKKK